MGSSTCLLSQTEQPQWHDMAETLHNYDTLIWFAIACTLIFSITGALAGSVWIFRHIDLPYYGLGLVAVFSFWASDIVENKRSSLQLEKENRIRFEELYVRDDPSQSIDLDLSLDLIIDYLSRIELTIIEGCEAHKYPHSCYMKSKLQENDYPFGLTIFDNIATNINNEEFLMACNAFSKRRGDLMSSSLSALDCARYHEGEFFDSSYLREKFQKSCYDFSPNIEFEDGFEPGSILSSINSHTSYERGMPAREVAVDQACVDVHQHQIQQRSYEREVAEIATTFNKKIENVEATTSIPEFLSGAVFLALWPYMMVLALAMKIGKWAAGTKPQVDRGPKGENASRSSGSNG